MTIYCLLYAVIPALKALTYCDSHIPAMDEINFLLKQVDEASIVSQLLLDDHNLFGSMRGVILSDCKEELDGVFGETNAEGNDELLMYKCFFFYLLFEKANKYYFSVMMMITTSSHLEIQFYLHGKVEE